ncbi:MAG: (d)CMP kinase [Bacteroidota bacterium]
MKSNKKEISKALYEIQGFLSFREMKIKPEKVNFKVAVDGFSSCGKSTLAKAIAKSLHFLYIDSGAMYRAVTLYCLQNNIPISINEVEAVLPQINIAFKNIDGVNHTFLNEKDIEFLIRTPEVSAKVSEIAAITPVRKMLVEQQRSLSQNKGVVMDGRDIGTVVFPNAQVKLFLVADLETRAIRRYEEMKLKNVSTTLEEVSKNLQHRDHIDSTREDSPLRKATDAIVIDNTYMDREEQLAKALDIIESKILAESK